MLRRVSFFLVLLGTLLGANPARAQMEVTYESFATPLAAHGEWIDVGGYGRVWRPWHMAASWRPYLYGHWVYTEDGWLWESDEAFGWATYHYGRWSYEDGYGWIWVPGYEWAPAWVEWRYSAGVVGWAPMYPVGMTIVRPVVFDHWTFVPSHSFVGVPVHTVAYSSGQVQAHWSSTVAAPGAIHGAMPVQNGQAHNNTPAFGGPSHAFVEQHVGRPVEVVKPVAVTSPSQIHGVGGSGAPVVFRPPNSVARPQPVTAPMHPTTNYPSATGPGVGTQPVVGPTTHQTGTQPQPVVGPTHPGTTSYTTHPGVQPTTQPTTTQPNTYQPRPTTGPGTYPMTTRPGGLQPTGTGSQPSTVRPLPGSQPAANGSQPSTVRPLPGSQPAATGNQPSTVRPTSQPGYQPNVTAHGGTGPGVHNQPTTPRPLPTTTSNAPANPSLPPPSSHTAPPPAHTKSPHH